MAALEQQGAVQGVPHGRRAAPRPGVRRGAETESAWKGNKRPVRPLEWHHTPTPEEMTAWEAKVRSHKGAGPVASLAERVERLEQQMKELLASPAAPVAQ